MKIYRKCFLVSTAEDLNSSQSKHNQLFEKKNDEYSSSSTVTRANSFKLSIKKTPNLHEVECFFCNRTIVWGVVLLLLFYYCKNLLLRLSELYSYKKVALYCINSISMPMILYLVQTNGIKYLISWPKNLDTQN